MLAYYATNVNIILNVVELYTGRWDWMNNIYEISEVILNKDKHIGEG